MKFRNYYGDFAYDPKIGYPPDEAPINLPTLDDVAYDMDHPQPLTQAEHEYFTDEPQGTEAPFDPTPPPEWREFTNGQRVYRRLKLSNGVTIEIAVSRHPSFHSGNSWEKREVSIDFPEHGDILFPESPGQSARGKLDNAQAACQDFMATLLSQAAAELHRMSVQAEVTQEAPF